jgi:hypothetical protein
MRIGYARISNADGSQVRNLQRDALIAAKRRIGMSQSLLQHQSGTAPPTKRRPYGLAHSYSRGAV